MGTREGLSDEAMGQEGLSQAAMELEEGPKSHDEIGPGGYSLSHGGMILDPL